jgi:hypothetical protein
LSLAESAEADWILPTFAVWNTDNTSPDIISVKNILAVLPSWISIN